MTHPTPNAQARRPAAAALRAHAIARVAAPLAVPALLAAAALPLAPVAFARAVLGAQTVTGTVRGVVRGPNGAGVADVQIAARNTGTNQTRGALTSASGSYTLGSLRPGTYQVTARRIGLAPQTRTLEVQVGQTLDLNFTLSETVTELTAVQVTAANAPVAERRTTEVATNVTQAQVNNLPTPSRNFLDLAQLAPGTRITPDRINGTSKSFAAGAQGAEQVNVFVDGASYKNDIIGGGIAGQDASRGNPFPRNAVQEFRIITNNFRAEYQKASSAIITAVTKSGTNTWQGSAFTELQNQNFVALDTFSRASGASRPSYSRYLTGLSGGGPLVRDKLFFFGSYEGNYQNREARTIFGGDPTKYPAAVRAFNNSARNSPFRENLGFGKLTYTPNERQLLELSGDVRHEVDTRGFGGQFGDVWRAYTAGENHRNNVYTGRAKHSLFGNGWTNEALASYQNYVWNQDPIDFATPVQVSYGNYWIGGNDATQNLKQNRLSLRDDYTYSAFRGAGDHVIKVGANYDFTRYDMDKRLNENPRYVYETSNNFQFPVHVTYGVGNGLIKQNNNQFGAYAQDTWNPTRRLTLDLGVRWDVETGMFNRDYVTPQAVRDSVVAYSSKLLVPVDPNRYFTNGTQRKLFLGGVQPRVGASYLLDQAGRTAVFASAGIFYDRLNFNATLDETYRRQHPIYDVDFSRTGGNGAVKWDTTLFTRAGLDALVRSQTPPAQEVFLIPNDLRPPRSNQWSVGVRRDFGGVNGSLTYNGTRSKNGFSYDFATVGYNAATNDCCVTVNVPAYRTILVGNNSVRTWYDALLMQLDKPYRTKGRFGWGAGIAYTLAKAEAEGGDLFSFPQVSAYGQTRHPINDDRYQQIVANWITDVPYAFGIQFSGLAQVASGTPYAKTQFVPLGNGNGNQRVILGRERTPWFRNVDVRLRKDFVNVGGNRAGVTGSVFNAFNTQNLGCYDETYANPGTTAGSTVPNPRFGTANCVIADPRRFQLGLTYDF